MFGTISPKVKGGLTRLQQVVQSGLGLFVSGPSDGDLTLTSADEAAQGVPRVLTLRSGSAVTAGVPGGNLRIVSGSAASVLGAARAGNIEITPGTGNLNGSSPAAQVQITGGADNANGGDVVLVGGAVTGPGSNGFGGGVRLTGGSGSATIGTGGPVAIQAGARLSGGQVTITGGSAGASTGLGGAISLTAGAGGSANTGGAINLFSGSGLNSGDIWARPGLNGAGTRGNILLDSGRGAALAVAATSGFVTLPSIGGVPTGDPSGTIPTAMIAVAVDATNLRVYFRIAGAWRYAQLV